MNDKKLKINAINMQQDTALVALISAHSNGDRTAIERLWQFARPLATRTLFKRGFRNNDGKLDMADGLQIVSIYINNNFWLFDSSKNIRPMIWLINCIKYGSYNAIKKLLCKPMLQKAISLDEPHGIGNIPFHDITEDTNIRPTPAIAERNDDFRLLHDVIKTLDPEQRELVQDYYFAEVSQIEIGKKMGHTRQAVQQKLYKICGILKERMIDGLHELPR